MQFIWVPYGALEICDESYQALCVRSYQTAPVAMLTFHLGALWQDVFGNGIFALRCLARLCVVAAIAIGALYYARRRKDVTGGCFLFMVCSLIASCAVLPLFNWDTGAYPFQALLLVTALETLRRPRWWICLALGGLCAVCTVARVPLAVTLPLALLLVWWRLRKRGQSSIMPLSAAVVSGFVVVWLLLTSAMCGSPAAYIETFIPENFISGHGPSDWHRLLWLAWVGIPELPVAWLPLTAAVVVALICVRWRHMSAPFKGYFRAICGGWVIFTALFSAVWHEYISRGMVFAFDFPLFAGAILIIPLWHLFRDRSLPIPWGTITVCLIAVALTALGSDHWYERYVSMFALPPLLAATADRYPSVLRLSMRYILSACAVAALTVFAVKFTNTYSSHRCDMSEFPLQQSIMGSAEDYSSWRSARHCMEALGEIDARILFLSCPYGLSLSFTDTLPPYFNNFHFRDATSPEDVPAEVTSGYDAIVFSQTPPESVPNTIRAIGQNGFITIPSCYTTGYNGFVMIRSEKLQPFLRQINQNRPLP